MMHRLLVIPGPGLFEQELREMVEAVFPDFKIVLSLVNPIHMGNLILVEIIVQSLTDMD